MADSQIRVLTLNCWGLKYVSKDRKQRIAAIARELAVSNYDIIALQELWVYADFLDIREAVSARLPYFKFFYSGALGAGLAVFTRYPIKATSIHPYSLNGEPMDVAAGDWFVGKAAGIVVISHPILGQVQIMNTHLFAKGGEDGPEYRRAHRLVNAWEFSKIARQGAGLGRYIIATGDFNSVPTTLPMQVIRQHTNLVDAWAQSHPTSPLQARDPKEAVSAYGVTADSPLNTYSAGKPLEHYARQFMGKRLDYVFFRAPIGKTTHALRCVDSRVVFTDPVPGHDFSYSDHFGLEATLQITDNITDESIAETELTATEIDSVVQALTACYRFSNTRGKRELMAFALCLIFVLGMIIGSPWLPGSRASPLFMLLTVFVTWLGTTVLYEGFIYGNWERNALMNVIEELETQKQNLGTAMVEDRNLDSWS